MLKKNASPAATSPPEMKGPNVVAATPGLLQSLDEITNGSIAHECAAIYKDVVAWA